jgi:hypothetical protein
MSARYGSIRKAAHSRLTANRSHCAPVPYTYVWIVDYAGKPVFGGGENSIVVYAIDPATGEPTLIQHVDPRSVHVRTFAIDPSGRMLVAASIKPLAVREGANVTTVPAALSVFRIGSNGKLEFARKYDVDAGGKIHYWMGMMGLG